MTEITKMDKKQLEIESAQAERSAHAKRKYTRRNNPASAPAPAPASGGGGEQLQQDTVFSSKKAVGRPGGPPAEIMHQFTAVALEPVAIDSGEHFQAYALDIARYSDGSLKILNSQSYKEPRGRWEVLRIIYELVISIWIGPWRGGKPAAKCGEIPLVRGENFRIPIPPRDSQGAQK